MSSPNQLSFLPDDYLERKRQRRTNVICCFLFMVVMAAIGSAFTLTERTVKKVEAEHAAVEADYTEAAKRIEQVKSMQDKQRKMANQAELTSSLLEKVPRSYLMAEITNAMPGGVSLLDFTLDARKRAAPSAASSSNKTALEKKKSRDAAAKQAASAPPAPTTYDVHMKMTGIAATDVQVAQFITKLNQSRLLKDVNLVISDEFEQDSEKLRRFQIELMLNPTAQVDPTEKKDTKTVSVEIEAK
ncbi:MAG: PilN domain-containing protein [Tepidisphaeraceae bacterium]